MPINDKHDNPFNDEPFDDGRGPELWEACPLGTLKNMAARLSAIDHAQRMKRAISGTALGLVAVAGALLLVNGVDHWMRPGGISCSECHGHFAEYHAHLTEPDSAAQDAVMDDAMAMAMRGHLASCSICRNAFNKKFPGELSATARAWPVVVSTAAALTAVQQ